MEVLCGNLGAGRTIQWRNEGGQGGQPPPGAAQKGAQNRIRGRKIGGL